MADNPYRSIQRPRSLHLIKTPPSTSSSPLLAQRQCRALESNAGNSHLVFYISSTSRSLHVTKSPPRINTFPRDTYASWLENSDRIISHCLFIVRLSTCHSLCPVQTFLRSIRYASFILPIPPASVICIALFPATFFPSCAFTVSPHHQDTVSGDRQHIYFGFNVKLTLNPPNVLASTSSLGLLTRLHLPASRPQHPSMGIDTVIPGQPDDPATTWEK